MLETRIHLFEMILWPHPAQKDDFAARVRISVRVSFDMFS
jgi:hypothetical protein